MNRLVDCKIIYLDRIVSQRRKKAVIKIDSIKIIKRWTLSLYRHYFQMLKYFTHILYTETTRAKDGNVIRFDCVSGQRFKVSRGSRIFSSDTAKLIHFCLDDNIQKLEKKMEPPEVPASSEKRRVAKSALFVLISVLFKRYSTAVTSCKFTTVFKIKNCQEDSDFSILFFSNSFTVPSLKTRIRQRHVDGYLSLLHIRSVLFSYCRCDNC